MIVGKGKVPLWSSPIVLAVIHYMAPMTWQIEPELSPCHCIRATQVTHFPATCQVDPGVVNVPIWGFVSHHLQISVGYYIPKSVGWCETLGHLPTPVDPSRLEGHTTYGEDPCSEEPVLCEDRWRRHPGLRWSIPAATCTTSDQFEPDFCCYSCKWIMVTCLNLPNNSQPRLLRICLLVMA